MEIRWRLVSKRRSWAEMVIIWVKARPTPLNGISHRLARPDERGEGADTLTLGYCWDTR